MFVVGGCREKGLCPNAIPLWPVAGGGGGNFKKKERNVLILVALKYAQNFECVY